MVEYIKRKGMGLMLCVATCGVLGSCKEYYRDYDYVFVNECDDWIKVVSVSTDSKAQRTDSLRPGESKLIATRKDVSGKDVWDIEAASQIYMFSKIDGQYRLNYSDNLRLRSLWEGPEEKDERGVYTLRLNRESFPAYRIQYIYAIENKSETHSLAVRFKNNEGTDSADTLAPGLYKWLVGFFTVRTEVTDLYADGKSQKIDGVVFSDLKFIADGDTISGARYGINNTAVWSFSKEPSTNEDGSPREVGLYTLRIDESVCW